MQVYLSAGLGNRLFQYAACKGMALRHGLELEVFAIDVNFEHGHHGNYLWNLIRMVDDPKDCLMVPRMMIHSAAAAAGASVWDQPPTQHLGHFEPPLEDVRGKVLYGYFQSELYFDHCRDELMRRFAEPAFITADIDRYLARAGIDVRSTVLIHVRLGDKIGDPRHFVDFTDYYRRCREAVGPGVRCVCVGESFADVRRFYPALADLEQVPRDASATMECFDLYLMARFKTVVCSNSTFSWWGAWLNPDPAKVVFLPSRHTNDPTNNSVGMRGATVVAV